MPRLGQTLVLCAALSVISASSLAFGQQLGYFVRGMAIDAQQHLIPVGERSLQHPEEGSYYMFDHTATQLTIVNHLAWQTGAANVRTLLYLEADRGVLERTVKNDEIVTGPFGALVIEKTCFYNRPVETYQSSIKVLVQSVTPEIGREIPNLVPAVPVELPPLTSISIVRIFRAAPQFVFASGNYEATGDLGSIQSGKVVNGAVQYGSSTVMPRAPQFENTRETSGLLRHVDVENYVRQKRLPLPKTSNTEERTVVILVYGFGELVREDALEDAVVVSSRYLRSVGTEEEGTLRPECDVRLHQQQSTGRSTVR